MEKNGAEMGTVLAVPGDQCLSAEGTYYNTNRSTIAYIKPIKTKPLGPMSRDAGFSTYTCITVKPLI